jgi:hypothetical protein
MDKIPASFKDDGVAFGDREHALDIAGWEGWRTYEELDDLGAADPNRASQQLLEHIEAVSGVFGDSVGVLSEAEQWRQLFGFDASYGHRVIITATEPTSPIALAYSEGRFDKELIADKLLDLGYTEEKGDLGPYYVVPDDQTVRTALQQNIDPGVPLRMNSIYVEEGVLMRMPMRTDHAEVFDTLAGDGPSLVDDEAFRALALALRDPLSAVLMTRTQAFEPPNISPTSQLEKQEGWGVLNEWEAMALGYGITDEERWWVLSLYYSDSDSAAGDRDELLNRMQGYTSLIPDRQERNLSPGRAYPEQPFVGLCEALSAIDAGADNGSILTVTCDLKDDTPPGAWRNFVIFRDFGFLRP